MSLVVTWFTALSAITERTWLRAGYRGSRPHRKTGRSHPAQDVRSHCEASDRGARLHEFGKGFTIQRSTLPLDDRIVLTEPKLRRRRARRLSQPGRLVRPHRSEMARGGYAVVPAGRVGSGSKEVRQNNINNINRLSGAARAIRIPDPVIMNERWSYPIAPWASLCS